MRESKHAVKSSLYAGKQNQTLKVLGIVLDLPVRKCDSPKARSSSSSLSLSTFFLLTVSRLAFLARKKKNNKKKQQKNNN